MRFIGPLLSLLAVSPLAFAAAPATDAKLERFSKLAANSNGGLIQLTDSLFTAITTAPRSYTAAVLFTALDKKYNCAMCKDFQPEYELLARSWRNAAKGEDGLYFGVLDFDNGRDTFMKVCPTRPDPREMC